MTTLSPMPSSRGTNLANLKVPTSWLRPGGALDASPFAKKRRMTGDQDPLDLGKGGGVDLTGNRFQQADDDDAPWAQKLADVLAAEGIDAATCAKVIKAVAAAWGNGEGEGDDELPDNAMNNGRSEVVLPNQNERERAAMAGDASLSAADEAQFYKDYPDAKRFGR